MTKQELKEYYWIKRNIDKLERRLEELNAVAMRNTTKIKKDADAIVSHGGISDRVGNAVAEMETITREIKNQIIRSYEVLIKIENAIEKLPAREAYLIRARYVELQSWEKIAVDMNYSWKQIHRIHSDALQELAKDDTQ